MFFTPRQKERADEDIRAYKREQRLRVDEEVFSYRESLQRKLDAEAKKIIENRFENEHDFHHDMETRRIKIAGLDAEIKNKEELVKKIDSIPALELKAVTAQANANGKDVAIEHLKADVTRLDELVKFVAGMLPKIEFDKLGLNLNADVTVEHKEKK